MSRANTLGILGGGQLGRMLVHAAQTLGLRTVVLDPDATAPAMRAADEALCAAYDDASALAQLAERCAAVTTEFENVPAASLALLAQSCAVSPPAAAVAVAQDRVAEKRLFERCAQQHASGIGPVPWAEVRTAEQLAAVPDALLPGVLKTARMGYDGKGQRRVANRADLVAAWEDLGQVPCVLEQQVALAAECSVIVARNAAGQQVHLPLQVNEHRGGILHRTAAGLSSAVFEQNPQGVVVKRAFDAANVIAQELQYQGVLCVELFVLADGSWAVNEIAPRPHNSGHHSIDSCDISQFELQARCAMGWPLVQPRQHSPCVMLNLLGDAWLTPEPFPQAELLALPGVHLHLYGKTDARAGRKMGHLTLTAPDAATLAATETQVCQLLGWA